VLNPAVLALQTYMLDFDCRLSSITGFVKWPDDDGYGPSLGLHHDSVVRHSLSIGKDSHTANCNWLLTDYTRDNGALAVVPGSHLRHHRPNVFQLEGVDEAIPVEAPAGSAVVFHGNLWHGAFPRKNPGLRLGLSTYYSRSYLQVNEDYRAALTPDVLERNPKRLGVLLGLASAWGWTSADGPRFGRAFGALAEACAEAGIPFNPLAT
jgi:ectoine hydroxylase-related dioxygenase (phytanoyl-CoA dioxygenase family)